MMNYPQLLYLDEEDHIISLFADPAKKDDVLNTITHRPEVKYNENMPPSLKNMGLYQIARMKDCPIDPAVITALVERWRPETNTFHLPFGEMTVTLEDVSILWGLSIKGFGRNRGEIWNSEVSTRPVSHSTRPVSTSTRPQTRPGHHPYDAEISAPELKTVITFDS